MNEAIQSLARTLKIMYHCGLYTPSTPPPESTFAPLIQLPARVMLSLTLSDRFGVYTSDLVFHTSISIIDDPDITSTSNAPKRRQRSHSVTTNEKKFAEGTFSRQHNCGGE